MAAFVEWPQVAAFVEWPQVAAFVEWLQVAAFLNSTPNATPLGCLVKGWSPAR